MNEADGLLEKVYRGARTAEGIMTASTVVSGISVELKLSAYGRRALSRIHPRVVSSLTIRRKIMASGTNLPDFIVCSACMPAPVSTFSDDDNDTLTKGGPLPNIFPQQVAGADGRQLSEFVHQALGLGALADSRRADQYDSGGLG